MGAMGFAAGACTAQKPPSSPDPMEAVLRAPRNHAVLYEDADIRLLEVTVLPGETEVLHDHPWSSVFIIDRPQPLFWAASSTTPSSITASLPAYKKRRNRR